MDIIEDPNCFPLCSLFALDFVPPSQIVWLSGSRHRAKNPYSRVHELYIQRAFSINRKRFSGSEARKEFLNLLGFTFEGWIQPLEGKEIPKNHEQNKHMCLPHVNLCWITRRWLRNERRFVSGPRTKSKGLSPVSTGVEAEAAIF